MNSKKHVDAYERGYYICHYASIMFTYVYIQQEYITCYGQRISETIVDISIVVTHLFCS
jgi:hypothetical protein